MRLFRALVRCARAIALDLFCYGRVFGRFVLRFIVLFVLFGLFRFFALRLFRKRFFYLLHFYLVVHFGDGIAPAVGFERDKNHNRKHARTQRDITDCAVKQRVIDKRHDKRDDKYTHKYERDYCECARLFIFHKP